MVVRYNVGRRDSLTVSVFAAKEQDKNDISRTQKTILELAPPIVRGIRSLMELLGMREVWSKANVGDESSNVDPIRNAIHHGTWQL